jgi:hypothetical protein
MPEGHEQRENDEHLREIAEKVKQLARQTQQSTRTANLPRMASTSSDERRVVVSTKSPLGSVRQDHRQAGTLVGPFLERRLH